MGNAGTSRYETTHAHQRYSPFALPPASRRSVSIRSKRSSERTWIAVVFLCVFHALAVSTVRGVLTMEGFRNLFQNTLYPRRRARRNRQTATFRSTPKGNPYCQPDSLRRRYMRRQNRVLSSIHVAILRFERLTYGGGSY
jgi:hypothetical protein